MKNDFLYLIRKNPDFSQLFKLISKYIDSKYKFLKPVYYDTYMAFSDELNSQPILVTTDSNNKRLILVNRYNGLNFVAQPKSIYNCTNFIDGAIRTYNYNKNGKKLEMDYVLKENRSILTKTFHRGVVAIYESRDKKFRKTTTTIHSNRPRTNSANRSHYNSKGNYHKFGDR